MRETSDDILAATSSKTSYETRSERKAGLSRPSGVIFVCVALLETKKNVGDARLLKNGHLM